jgi:hypothetical protein
VFPGGKAGRCVRLTTLQPSCVVVMRSGNFNFLESSGPLQECNGTALPILDALISQIYFPNKNLHVSDSSYAHHQQFFTVHTAMYMSYSLRAGSGRNRPDPARKLSAYLYILLFVQ